MTTIHAAIYQHGGTRDTGHEQEEGLGHPTGFRQHDSDLRLTNACKTAKNPTRQQAGKRESAARCSHSKMEAGVVTREN